jgi:putative ABC transport system substrate-binding protein
MNNPIHRRSFLTLLGGASAAAWPLAARAQQPRKNWRVGILDPAPEELSAANIAALQNGLRELGYLSGRDLEIDYRSTDGRYESLPDLAFELVRLKPDLILVRGTPQTMAVKKATTTIPVVMAAVADPVGSGIVSSLPHPGGNITGLSTFGTEVEAKRVELLKEMVPGLTRIGMLLNVSNSASGTQLGEVQRAARILGIEVRRLDVRNAADVGLAFETAMAEGLQALIIAIDTLILTNRGQIIRLAAERKLPAVYASREFVLDGGLMSYGVSYPQLYYRAASFVDKIFKGARPSDIPVEQPTQIELVLNLKTARALGLTVPPTARVLATEVIE